MPCQVLFYRSHLCRNWRADYKPRVPVDKTCGYRRAPLPQTQAAEPWEGGAASSPVCAESSGLESKPYSLSFHLKVGLKLQNNLQFGCVQDRSSRVPGKCFPIMRGGLS